MQHLSPSLACFIPECFIWMLRKTVINAFVKHNRYQLGKAGQYLPSHSIALLGFLLLEGSGLLSSSGSQNDVKSYKYKFLLSMIAKISKTMLILICLRPTLYKPKFLICQSDTYTLNTNGTISRNFSLKLVLSINYFQSEIHIIILNYHSKILFVKWVTLLGN